MEPMARPSPRHAIARTVGILLTLAFLLSVALSPATALADGDPGSDVLVYQSLFVTSTAGVSVAKQVQLNGLLAQAKQKGVPIRVAIIAHPSDLGAVSELWGKPRPYARFLGYELSLAYHDRLLVVMPSGFGGSWPKHSTRGAYRALASTHIPSGGDGLATAAESAVVAVAHSAGVTLRVPTGTAQSTSASGGQATSARATAPAAQGGTAGGRVALIAGIAVLALLVGGGAAL